MTSSCILWIKASIEWIFILISTSQLWIDNDNPSVAKWILSPNIILIIRTECRAPRWTQEYRKKTVYNKGSILDKGTG